MIVAMIFFSEISNLFEKRIGKFCLSWGVWLSAICESYYKISLLYTSREHIKSIKNALIGRCPNAAVNGKLYWSEEYSNRMIPVQGLIQ